MSQTSFFSCKCLNKYRKPYFLKAIGKNNNNNSNSPLYLKSSLPPSQIKEGKIIKSENSQLPTQCKVGVCANSTLFIIQNPCHRGSEEGTSSLLKVTQHLSMHVLCPMLPEQGDPILLG